MKTERMWSLLSIVLSFLTSQCLAGTGYTILYNGDNKVQLALENPFLVEILQVNDKLQSTLVASFLLPNSTEATSVTGSKTGIDETSVKFGLNIQYSKAITSKDGTLNGAKINLEIIYKTSVG